MAMLDLLRRPPSASDAARALARKSAEARAERAERQRRKMRDMTNRIRADLRAKGRADLPDIDWSNFQ